MSDVNWSIKSAETYSNVKTQTCGVRMTLGGRLSTVLLASSDFQEESKGYSKMEFLFSQSSRQKRQTNNDIITPLFTKN